MRGAGPPVPERRSERGVERHADAGFDQGNVHHRHAGTGARLERVREGGPLAGGDDVQVRRGLRLAAERPPALWTVSTACAVAPGFSVTVAGVPVQMADRPTCLPASIWATPG